MIIVQPIGGLCNRIRSVNSALRLAEERSDRLVILWFLNKELNCSFEKLFNPAKHITVLNIHTKWDIRKLFYQLTSQFIPNSAIYPYRMPIGQKGPVTPDARAFFQSLKRRCYLATEESFYPTKDYSAFLPTDELKTRLAKLTERFAPHTIGVHIRRTDHGPACESSTTAAFLDAMKKKLMQNPNTLFYVATDDLDEEKFLRSAFQDKILSNRNRNLDRNCEAGIQDALLDLLALSQTQEMIGSYYSSFTDMAADIGGIPKEVAGK